MTGEGHQRYSAKRRKERRQLDGDGIRSDAATFLQFGKRLQEFIMPTSGTPFSIYDVIGLCGVLAYIGAYFGTQILHMKPSSTAYGALNVAGPVLTLVSLSHAFNLAAFLTQAFWLVITLAGMLRKKQRSKE
jgi:hypothetical protein